MISGSCESSPGEEQYPILGTNKEWRESESWGILLEISGLSHQSGIATEPAKDPSTILSSHLTLESMENGKVSELCKLGCDYVLYPGHSCPCRRPLVPRKDCSGTGSINFDGCLRDTAEGDPACPSFRSCELPMSRTSGSWDAFFFYSAYNLSHLTLNFLLMQINSLFYFWEHQNQYDGTTDLQKSDYSTCLALLCILVAPHSSSLAAKCSGFPFPNSVAASPTVSPTLKCTPEFLQDVGAPLLCAITPHLGE